MMSASARARRRGAMTEGRFRLALAERGFLPVKPHGGELHAFVHAARPGRRFAMPMSGDTFSRALCRITEELERE